MPQAVQEAVGFYRDSNDWLAQFIEDHCEVLPSYQEQSGTLYQTYRSACLQNGEYIRSTTDFYGALERAGFKRRRIDRGRLIVGLRLKEGQDFPAL